VRRYYHQQLLEVLNTTSEAWVEIRRLLSIGNLHAASRLVADCYDAALDVSDFIQRLEGDGTKVSSLLLEYINFLAAAKVDAEDSAKCEQFVKHGRKCLMRIENSVRNDLRANEFMILFVPYKASMWDSMESVWLAARDDPQCQDVVMPIPYFERAPDGEFSEMCYEGAQYPSYVPIMDWQQFNIQEQHPDIIVFHYPYDSDNYVTSMHEDYFAVKLRQAADMLVYIPYFVTMNDVPEHFCVQPGTLLADKIIAQSDQARNDYARHLRQYEKQAGIEGALSRFSRNGGSVLALGSPKFDKVLHTRREDCQIPAEWYKYIEKPDGTRKKIVLFITTIANTLQGNEQIIRTLRRVFDCFVGRDDVALLWRPHPLIIATYASMRPGLLEEYLSVVGFYKQTDIGIYDDTGDLHRAIALSDAYYGPWSSLFILFQITGKPMMLQNEDIENKAAVQPKPADELPAAFYKDPAACTDLFKFHYQESDSHSLRDYLDYIVLYGDSPQATALGEQQVRVRKASLKNADGSAGREIYKHLKAAFVDNVSAR
jgi:hypothetical protein